jgi:hypothetical protein
VAKQAGRISFASETRLDLRLAAAELLEAERELAAIAPTLDWRRRREAERAALRRAELARRFLATALARHGL